MKQKNYSIHKNLLNEISENIDEEISDIFEFQSEIGKGSYGVVLKAKYIKSQKEVAVKVIPKKGLSIEILQYIMKESDMLSCLNHQNNYNLSENLYIVMELVKDGTLRQFLELRKSLKKPIQDEDASIIMKNIFSALVYLHSSNIIHRDIKPENILIDNFDNLNSLRIADFGLSKQLEFALPQGMLKSKVGTLLYMAPEIEQTIRAYGKPVDIWSCGIIMFELLNDGKHPLYIKSQDDRESFKKKLAKPKWNLNQFQSDFAKDLFQKLVCLMPSERYSAEQALIHPWISRKFDKQIPLTQNQFNLTFANQQKLIRIIKILYVIKYLIFQYQFQKYQYKLGKQIDLNTALQSLSKLRNENIKKNPIKISKQLNIDLRLNNATLIQKSKNDEKSALQLQSQLKQQLFRINKNQNFQNKMNGNNQIFQITSPQNASKFILKSKSGNSLTQSPESPSKVKHINLFQDYQNQIKVKKTNIKSSKRNNTIMQPQNDDKPTTFRIKTSHSQSSHTITNIFKGGTNSPIKDKEKISIGLQKVDESNSINKQQMINNNNKAKNEIEQMYNLKSNRNSPQQQQYQVSQTNLQLSNRKQRKLIKQPNTFSKQKSDGNLMNQLSDRNKQKQNTLTTKQQLEEQKQKILNMLNIPPYMSNSSNLSNSDKQQENSPNENQKQQKQQLKSINNGPLRKEKNLNIVPQQMKNFIRVIKTNNEIIYIINNNKEQDFQTDQLAKLKQNQEFLQNNNLNSKESNQNLSNNFFKQQLMF